MHRVTFKTALPRIDGDEGAGERGGGGNREAAARCNFFTNP